MQAPGKKEADASQTWRGWVSSGVVGEDGLVRFFNAGGKDGSGDVGGGAKGFLEQERQLRGLMGGL